MENRPLITLTFVSGSPGVDAELYERFMQWVDEVYIPIGMKSSDITGTDRCQIVKESPEYPQAGTIRHCANFEAWERYQKLPEREAIRGDLSAWENRGVQETIWSAGYELERSFRSIPRLQENRADTKIDNAPIMHLEGYRLSAEEQEKYGKWLSDYGYNVFIPLFIRLPGFKGYDFFKDKGLKRRETREVEYPSNLSIFYFENLKAYEDYKKSQELVIFQKALRTVFPRGLKYKWYVQYQLVKSWRK